MASQSGAAAGGLYFAVLVDVELVGVVGGFVRVLVEDSVSEVGPFVDEDAVVGAECVEGSVGVEEVFGGEVEVHAGLAAACCVVDYVGCVDYLGAARFYADVGAVVGFPGGVVDARMVEVVVTVGCLVGFESPGVGKQDCDLFEISALSCG